MRISRLILDVEIPEQGNKSLEIDFSSDGIDIYSDIEKEVIIVDEKSFAENLYNFYRSRLKSNN